MSMLFIIFLGVISIIVVKVNMLAFFILITMFILTLLIQSEINNYSFGKKTHLILLQIVHPKNKDISDIPGLAPPVVDRKLLWIPHRD